MKKVLVVILALAFVMPVGIGMFGGSPPQPVVQRGPGGQGGPDPALQRELEAGIRGRCAALHEVNYEQDACHRRQMADFKAVVELMRKHEGKPAGPKIEECVNEFVPKIDATADWSLARACLKERAKL